MAVITYTKGQKANLSQNFSSLEFDCHCSYPECQTTLIEEDLVNLLQTLREEVDEPINIDDGYRCPRHNAEVGGAPRSQHQLGLAADIKINNYTPPMIAEKVESLLENNGGRGLYDTFVHCDVRKNGPSRWDLRTKK